MKQSKYKKKDIYKNEKNTFVAYTSTQKTSVSTNKKITLTFTFPLGNY